MVSKRQRVSERRAAEERKKTLFKRTEQLKKDYDRLVESKLTPVEQAELRILSNNPHKPFVIVDANSLGGAYTEEVVKIVHHMGGTLYITDGVRHEMGKEGAVNAAKRFKNCGVDYAFLEDISDPDEYTLPIKHPISGEVYNIPLKGPDMRKVTPRNVKFTVDGVKWDKRNELWDARAGEAPPSPEDEGLIRTSLRIGTSAKKVNKRLETVYVLTADKRHVSDSYLSRHIQEEMGIFFGNGAEVFMKLYQDLTARGYEGTIKQKILAAAANELDPFSALHFGSRVKEENLTPT